MKCLCVLFGKEFSEVLFSDILKGCFHFRDICLRTLKYAIGKRRNPVKEMQIGSIVLDSDIFCLNLRREYIIQILDFHRVMVMKRFIFYIFVNYFLKDVLRTLQLAK